MVSSIPIPREESGKLIASLINVKINETLMAIN